MIPHRGPVIVQLAAALLSGCPGVEGPSAQSAVRREYRPGFDVLDYDLTLDLPDSGRAIRGTAVLTVRRTGAPADHRARSDTLTLDLVRLSVSSVAINGRAVGFARTAETIRVPLPAGQLDTLRVTVNYGGEVRDGLVIRADAQGRWTAFGDNWPNRARHWIPSIDHPSDKATVSWTVRTPPGRTVVANGRQLPPERIRVSYAGTRTTRWREDRPIPTYTMVIAAAPLVRHELGASACGLAELERCVEQAVYTTPEIGDYVPGPFATAGAIVDWMARLVGPFPYEKLAHVQSSTIYGGMENASAIFYDERLFRDRAMSVGLIAHETAHQWFGDAVTEREWAHLWLSEGFATYFSALWTEHARGDSAFRAEMAATRAQILADSSAVPRRPVIDTIETNLTALLNANSYQKGGWTLHMLRRLVGDSAFFRGIRQYYGAHRHGTALTDDFRRAVEATSGRQLAWFFDQWLRRPGYPTPVLSWTYDSTAARVSVTVRQERSRFGAYRFPLTLAVQDASGAVRKVVIDVAPQPLTTVQLPFDLSARPTEIVPDPDVDLLAVFGRP
jgi:aminopeptidase N